MSTRNESRLNRLVEENSTERGEHLSFRNFGKSKSSMNKVNQVGLEVDWILSGNQKSSHEDSGQAAKDYNF